MIISDLIELLQKINEKDAEGFCFEVRHKILEIPRESYLKTLSDHEEPFSEETVQYLVEEYLDWKDEHGIPGMIRIKDNQKKNKVKLDAAVRYLINCEDSTCKKCQ